MKFIFVSFFILFVSFNYIADPTGTKKKNSIHLKGKFIEKTGLKFLENKKIQIILPFELGFRNDLYDKNGNLLESEFYDSEGNLIETSFRVAIEKRNYNSFGFLKTLETFDKNKTLSSTLRFDYDTGCLQLKKEDSCAKEISLVDEFNKPLANEEGIFRYQAEFDLNCLKNENRRPKDCQKLEVKFDKKLKVIADNEGNAKVIKTFDDQGNLNLNEIYDKFGSIKNKVIYAYDYKCIEITKIPIGCIIYQEYTNRATNNKSAKTNYGKKVVTYDLNCIQAKKNSENCINVEENYDANGKLKDISHRFTFGCIDYSLELGAYAKRISKYDKKGNEILREFYNSKNKLIEDSSGGAKYVYAYIQECNPSEKNSHSCRILTEIYDKNLKLKYKAINDETCIKNERASLEESNYCAAWKEIYSLGDEKNKSNYETMILKADFDSKGFKKNLEQYNIKEKLSIRTVFYFDEEKLTRKENQDANGNLVEDNEGIATYSFEYGKYKFTIKEETFAKDGNLKANSDGIARMIFAYDENCLKRKSNRYECSSLEEFYDEKGNFIEYTKNIENTLNYARIVREFDKNGNIILESYFDKNNRPKKNLLGVAMYKFKYNEMGDKIVEEHFGRKVNVKHKINFTYDLKCKKIAKDYSCINSIIHSNKRNKLIDKDILNNKPFAKEINSYNHICIETMSDPSECIEKNEFTNSKNELVYAEYFQYIFPSIPDSEIKFIKLRMSQDKNPIGAEFIK